METRPAGPLPATPFSSRIRVCVPIPLQNLDSLPRLLHGPPCRPPIKFQCQLGVPAHAEGVQRAKYLPIIGFSHHKGSACAAFIRGVFEQKPRTREVELLDQRRGARDKLCLLGGRYRTRRARSTRLGSI